MLKKKHKLDEVLKVVVMYLMMDLFLAFVLYIPSNRRLLYELPPSVPGVPDGAQCDRDGYLWVEPVCYLFMNQISTVEYPFTL